ncbi:MAG TPA: pyridoxal phosphate-dependent aminotransferase [Fimbriimonadaceae bacterium]|nr:pyridoxal phosphate-dependent aminotransferase [Fimbriimonadaceae bacterium]
MALPTADIGRVLSRQTEAFSSPVLRQITQDVERVRGINLGQGVCNLPPPELLLRHATDAAYAGINRYTNPRGLKSFRDAMAAKLASFNGIEADPETQILATCGATGGFEAVCAVLLNPGDEVVVFEPTYPYHMQALKRYHAEARILPLESPHWTVDFDRLRAVITPRTKFVLVNTPGNPTGKVFSGGELLELAEVLSSTDALLVTDEIYEYMTFDGRPHVSPGSLPELADRTLTIGGYSKTFAITGWRIGYLVVPAPLSEAMTSFLDAVYVCAPAPLQQAVAETVNELGPEFYADLRAKYEKKRDAFYRGLEAIGLDPVRTEGSYYMICGFERRFPGVGSMEFVSRMIRESGVGAVPSSDFVRDHESAKWVRFCLAQEDEVLQDALRRLDRLGAT